MYPASYNYISLSGNYCPLIWKDRKVSTANTESLYNYNFPLIEGNNYKITVIVDNDIFRLFINDSYIGIFAFKSFGNNVGFSLSEKIAVEIDDITVYSYSSTL